MELTLTLLTEGFYFKTETGKVGLKIQFFMSMMDTDNCSEREYNMIIRRPFSLSIFAENCASQKIIVRFLFSRCAAADAHVVSVVVLTC